MLILSTFWLIKYIYCIFAEVILFGIKVILWDLT